MPGHHHYRARRPRTVARMVRVRGGCGGPPLPPHPADMAIAAADNRHIRDLLAGRARPYEPFVFTSPSRSDADLFALMAGVPQQLADLAAADEDTFLELWESALYVLTDVGAEQIKLGVVAYGDGLRFAVRTMRSPAGAISLRPQITTSAVDLADALGELACEQNRLLDNAYRRINTGVDTPVNRDVIVRIIELRYGAAS